MVQYIPGDSLSAGFGSALGQGLSQGISLLAQDRIQKLHEKRRREETAKGLEAFVSPEEARTISLLPEPLQKEFLQQRQLQSLLGDATRQEQDIGKERTAPSGIEKLSDSQLVGLSGRSGGIGQVAKAELSRRQEGKKEGFQEKKLALQETKEFRKSVGEKLRNAKDVSSRLDRLQELTESGKLTNAPTAYLLERLPGDLTFLLNPESQEFQKLSLDLTAGLARDFGNRINISEFKTFLKRVPTLLQTDEGKQRVIRNMRLIQVEPALLRGNAANEIIKENQGIPPIDLEEQVEEKVSPRLDQIAEQVKSGFQASEKKRKSTKEEIVKEGYVKVRSPEGQEGQIPKARIKEALESGYERI